MIKTQHNQIKKKMYFKKRETILEVPTQPSTCMNAARDTQRTMENRWFGVVCDKAMDNGRDLFSQMVCGVGLGSSRWRALETAISGQLHLPSFSCYLFLDFDFGRSPWRAVCLKDADGLRGSDARADLSPCLSTLGFSPLPSLPWSLSVPGFPHFLPDSSFPTAVGSPQAPGHSDTWFRVCLSAHLPILFVSCPSTGAQLDLLCLFFF